MKSDLVIDKNISVSVTILLDYLILSPTYRWSMRVTEVHIYKDETSYAQCPRCKGIVEYEYQFFCGRCGQRIDWFGLDDAKEVYIGWSGPKDDEDEID